jgi:hypothetical protein
MTPEDRRCKEALQSGAVKPFRDELDRLGNYHAKELRRFDCEYPDKHRAILDLIESFHKTWFEPSEKA